MKFPLPDPDESRSISSPWTEEDSAIIQRGGRTHWAIALRTMGLQQDMREADVIWRAQCFRHEGFTAALRAQHFDGTDMYWGGDVYRYIP